jgi:hypothetical protein
MESFEECLLVFGCLHYTCLQIRLSHDRDRSVGDATPTFGVREYLVSVRLDGPQGAERLVIMIQLNSRW